MAKLIRIKSKKLPQWVDYVSLFFLMALAGLLRSVAQFTHVFQGQKVVFREVDPYYQVRLVENMAANNFLPMKWDMFAQYPDGAPVGYGPVIGWLSNWAAYVGSIGSPSQHLVQVLAAWVPVVAAVAVVAVVYFLGMEVFKSRFAALLGALLVAIIPSELLHRSLLGFTDHHILEVLFSSLVILCLIKAMRLKSWYWCAGAVASFALYAVNWIGWPILAAVIVNWTFVYFGWKHTKGKVQLAYFIIPVVLVALAVAFIPYARDLAYQFISNTFLGFASTIQEAHPISVRDFYLLYGISGIVAFGGIYLAIKNKINSLFLAWTIFMILASIAEKRWGYYSTIGLSMFAAYAVWWSGSKVRKDWKAYILIYCCIAIVFTTYPYTMGVIKRGVDINPDWYSACIWMRVETPDPFDNPYAYYQHQTVKASYGVFSWWDYGHWIIQIGHRVPLTSPTQQESVHYGFFTADSEDKANQVIKDLNIKYVVIDEDMVTGKYYAIWRKVTGSQAGWQDSIQSSMVYKMYYSEVETWKMIQRFGAVKVFERSQ